MVNAVKMGVVDPVVFNDSTNFVIDAFFTNKVAIGYIGTWAIAEGSNNYPDFKDEWDYVFLRQVRERGLLANFGWGLTVCPMAKNQDVTWDFVKFATTVPANAVKFNIASGTITAMPAVAKAPRSPATDALGDQALDILPNGEYLGNVPDDLVMYEIIYPPHPGSAAGSEDGRRNSASH